MTITRLPDGLWYVLSAAGAELRDLDYLVQSRRSDEDVQVKNVTDDRGNLVVRKLIRRVPADTGD